MIFNRIWAMPSSNTFSIKPVKELVLRHVHGVSVDPFANRSRMASITNDLDPQYGTRFVMEACEFLALFDTGSVDVVLFDPPFSPRQVSMHYKKLGRTVNSQTTQKSYWGNLKKEIGRIVKIGGKAVSCGWNSGGIGKTLGFEIEEILLVPHGGGRNDTIVTVDVKKGEKKDE